MANIFYPLTEFAQSPLDGSLGKSILLELVPIEVIWDQVALFR